MPRIPSPARGLLAFLALTAPALLLGPVEETGAPLISITAQARTSAAGAGTAAHRPDAPADSDDERTIPGSEICADAGYLCASLASYDSYRVIRFPSTTDELRIRVPRPAHERGQLARALQAAAIRGIEAWDGRPFPIRFVEEDDAGTAHVVLRWEAQLPDGGLGETQSRFKREGGIARYRVPDLALATRNPYHSDTPLSAGDIELTAAHEMGHALGLPHSDDRGDLMYPTDAATHLSDRDFHTLQALYRVPNGVRIVK